MREKTQRKVEKVLALIGRGIPAGEARSRANISAGTFYAARKTMVKRPQPKREEPISLPVAPLAIQPEQPKEIVLKVGSLTIAGPKHKVLNIINLLPNTFYDL